MAVKKKQAQATGAPEWMVTYGDMVTLLLTFFVLLLAMSEIKQNQRMMDFMQAVREAFGYVGGIQHLPTDEVIVPKNYDDMSFLILPIYPDNLGRTNEEGAKGKQDLVTTIRPGKEYQPGGRFHFEELSAELSPEEAERVAEYARDLRGFSTVIEIRGHCNKRPVEGSPFVDHMDLSLQRARAVERIMLVNGIDAQRIRVVGAGTTHPITRSTADINLRSRNDIVELIQIDQTIADCQP